MGTGRGPLGRPAEACEGPETDIMIDDAMHAMEASNESHRAELPKVLGKESSDRSMLTGLIDLCPSIKPEGS